MKTFIAFNKNNEILGKVEANSFYEAEEKFIKIYKDYLFTTTDKNPKYTCKINSIVQNTCPSCNKEYDTFGRCKCCNKDAY